MIPDTDSHPHPLPTRRSNTAHSFSVFFLFGWLAAALPLLACRYRQIDAPTKMCAVRQADSSRRFPVGGLRASSVSSLGAQSSSSNPCHSSHTIIANTVGCLSLPFYAVGRPQYHSRGCRPRVCHCCIVGVGKRHNRTDRGRRQSQLKDARHRDTKRRKAAWIDPMQSQKL